MAMGKRDTEEQRDLFVMADKLCRAGSCLPNGGWMSGDIFRGGQLRIKRSFR